MMEDERILILVCKYRENKLNGNEFKELKAWTDECAENRLLMENFLKMYKLESQTNALHQIDPHKSWNRLQRRLHPKRPHWIRYAAVAACLAGTFFLATHYLSKESEPERQPVRTAGLLESHGQRKATLKLTNGETIEVADSAMTLNEELLAEAEKAAVPATPKSQAEKLNEVSVPRGGEFSLTLPDGTKVWINSESVLRFPSSFSDTRKVTLQGEAYFDVAKTGTPFEVTTDAMTIRVLGTRFNVSAYRAESALATLVQGGVEVENANGKVRLAPGQQAVIPSDKSEIKVREVNVSIYTAWVTGVFDFNDTPLEDITQQLARWYDVEVDYAQPALRRIRFSGTILRKESLGYALELIQKVSDVKFVVDDKRVKVETR